MLGKGWDADSTLHAQGVSTPSSGATSRTERSEQRRRKHKPRLVWKDNHQENKEEKEQKGRHYSAPVSKGAFPVFNMNGIVIKYY